MVEKVRNKVVFNMLNSSHYLICKVLQKICYIKLNLILRVESLLFERRMSFSRATEMMYLIKLVVAGEVIICVRGCYFFFKHSG